jgi:hypothetical protein
MDKNKDNDHLNYINPQYYDDDAPANEKPLFPNCHPHSVAAKMIAKTR